jgi:integrase
VGEQTAKQISPATINKDLRTLRAVFSRAVRREILEVNPFSRVDKLREPEKVKRILSDNELAKLLPELKRRDHAVYGAVLVALSTGLRIGELANLKWAEVDLASGDLHVVNRADWRTKSTRNRYEWLPEFVRDALGPLQGRPWQGYVFADREPGKWYFRAADVFDAAVKAAKIAHCTFHDLRETALTRMAEGGAGVWVLQSIAGHSTPNVTAKHYVGVGREAVRSVISRHGERLKVAVGA